MATKKWLNFLQITVKPYTCPIVQIQNTLQYCFIIIPRDNARKNQREAGFSHEEQPASFNSWPVVMEDLSLLKGTNENPHLAPPPTKVDLSSC